MKAMWAVVCVAVAAAVCGPAVAVESFDRVVPEGTLVFVSVRDVPELLKKIKEVPAYKVFEEGLLEKLLPAEVLERGRELWGRYVEPLGEVLGGEVAFAVTDVGGFEEDPGLVLLVDVAGREEALERYLEKAIFPLAAESEAIVLEQMQLKGVKTRRLAGVREWSPQALIGVKDGVLVVAWRQDTFEAMVEALGGGNGEGLSGNKAFADMRRSVGDADVMGYVDIEGLIKAYDEARAAMAAEMAKAAEVEEAERQEDEARRDQVEAVTGFRVLRAAGFGMTLGPEGGTTTMRLVGDGPPTGGIFGALARPAPALKSVKYVSPDAAAYVAVSVGSFSRIYTELMASLKAFEEASEWHEPLTGVEEALGVLEGVLGMKFEEEVLAAFGGEAAVAAWVPQGFDVPPGAVMIEVKDRAAARHLVERLLELVGELSEGAIAAQRKTYEGVEIAWLEDVPMVFPAVGLVGDFLVVATNPSVIEDMIDTLADGEHLGGDADYGRCVSALPGDAAATVYVSGKRVFEWGYPLLVAYVRGVEGIEEDETTPLVRFVEGLEPLGEVVSGFGLKVMGDENGATVISRSALGGLGPVSFLGGLCLPVMRTQKVEQRTPGTSSVEFGRPGGYVAETMPAEEMEEALEEDTE